MDISSEWRNRHPRAPGSSGKLLALILILAMVVFFILKSDVLASGFTALVSPDSAATE
jgi:hypothetical protein